MDDSKEKKDYLDFMNWFQNVYPDLYVLHWQRITMAKNGNGITVDGGNPDEFTKNVLTSLLSEYYTKTQ